MDKGVDDGLLPGLAKTCVYWLQRYLDGQVFDSDLPYLTSLKRSLKELVTLKAEMIAAANDAFIASPENPGYLEYTNSRGYRLYIPWFIIDDFPSREIGDELVKIAVSVKACKTSDMCLSGSALYFGALQSISDIDYLEYFVNEEDDPIIVAEPSGFHLVKNRADRYLEYVHNPVFYGAIVVSNKLVQLDDAAETDYTASEESNPFQEAAIRHTPRKLYDPYTLGTYINFLARQTVKALSKGPLKVPKRLLPLARIMGNEPLADFICASYSDDAISLSLKIKQKQILLSRAYGSAHAGMQTTIAEIEEELETLDDDLLSLLGQDTDGETLLAELADTMCETVRDSKRWINSLIVEGPNGK